MWERCDFYVRLVEFLSHMHTNIQICVFVYWKSITSIFPPQNSGRQEHLLALAQIWSDAWLTPVILWLILKSLCNSKQAFSSKTNPLRILKSEVSKWQLRLPKSSPLEPILCIPMLLGALRKLQHFCFSNENMPFLELESTINSLIRFLVCSWHEKVQIKNNNNINTDG